MLQPQPDDRFVGSPPLAFTFGLGGLVLFPFRAGATAILLEKSGPDELLAAIPKMRPTVVYGLFAFVLGTGLWLQGRSYLRYLMGEVMPLTEEGWMLFTRNWVFFFAAMAVFNEFTWRVLGEEAWIWLDTFGQMILTFVFLATQLPTLTRHTVEDEDQG